jgi:UDP-N-acetylglucosamine 4,6-dehydratase
MITEDDARTTLEMDDRYVIEPAFGWWDRSSYQNDGAAGVADGFVYASNRNPERLDATGLAELVGHADPAFAEPGNRLGVLGSQHRMAIRPRH